MTTPNRLWSLAARQHRLLSTAQLRAAGLTTAAIEHRVRTGRLHRVRRGVYAVGRPAESFDALAMSALLAVGPAAVLSHLAAAFLWGIVERFAGPVGVTLPSQTGRARRAGVEVHRCATLGPYDITRHRLVPVTSVTRTLRDLAGALPVEPLRATVRAAERLHRLDLPGAHELVAEPLTGRREARLRCLLEQHVSATPDPAREEAFFEALVRIGVALPVAQRRTVSVVPDFLWPQERLIVETDDRAIHAGRLARAEDEARDRRLAERGYLVLRFTWTALQMRPDAIARDVRAALERRRCELGLEPLSAPPRNVERPGLPGRS